MKLEMWLDIDGEKCNTQEPQLFLFSFQGSYPWRDADIYFNITEHNISMKLDIGTDVNEENCRAQEPKQTYYHV